METNEFLQLVLPPANGGFYECFGIYKDDKDRVVQTFHRTIDELIAQTTLISSQGYHAYYGLSSFINPNRDIASAVQRKCFTFDVDAVKLGNDLLKAKDETKRLIDLLGVKDYATVVFSGRGFHVYIILDEAAESREWHDMSRALSKVAVDNLVTHDIQVTTTIHGVMRTIGTINYRCSDLQQCRVVKLGKSISYENLSKIIQPLPNTHSTKEYVRPVDETTANVMGVEMPKLDNVLARCQNMRLAYENQNDVDNPLWYACLGVANQCEPDAIHRISKEYDGYSFDETEKVGRRSHPSGCEKFEEVNPFGCEGCEFRGQKLYPVNFGRAGYIPKKPESPQDILSASSVQSEEDKLFEGKYKYPYRHALGGGIEVEITEGEGDDKETRWVKISQRDVFIDTIVRDRDDTDEVIVIFKYYTDIPIKERLVRVPARLFRNARDVLAEINAVGVIPHESQKKAFMQYLTTSFNEFQNMHPEVGAFGRFGWINDNTEFVIGERKFSANGITRCHPSQKTKEMAAALTSTGHLDEWRKVIDLYNQPHLYPHAFTILQSFGTPLMELANPMISGVITSLYSKESGTGKTTAMMVASSIWGHPTRQFLLKKDTKNAKEDRIGRLVNLPVFIDEASSMPAEDKIDLCYSVSEGRGKHRLTITAEQRKNSTAWTTTVTLTTNKSFLGDMAVDSSIQDGPAKRVIEFDCPLLSPEDLMRGRHLSKTLSANYGVAGEIMIQYICANKAKCIDLFSQELADITNRLGNEPADRFYASALATASAGGKIAKELGLHSIDVDYVIKRVINVVIQQKLRLGSVLRDIYDDLLGDFIAKNYGKLTRENANANIYTEGKVNEVVGKLQTVDGDLQLSIVSSAFNDFCKGRELVPRDTLEKLDALGVVLKRNVPVRVTPQTPAKCHVFRMIDGANIIAKLDADSMGAVNAGEVSANSVP